MNHCKAIVALIFFICNYLLRGMHFFYGKSISGVTSQQRRNWSPIDLHTITKIIQKNKNAGILWLYYSAIQISGEADCTGCKLVLHTALDFKSFVLLGAICLSPRALRSILVLHFHPRLSHWKFVTLLLRLLGP